VSRKFSQQVWNNNLKATTKTVFYEQSGLKGHLPLFAILLGAGGFNRFLGASTRVERISLGGKMLKAT